MKTKAIKPVNDSNTLVYDGIKGKVAREIRVFCTSTATTTLVISFEDDTELQVALDYPPLVNFTLHRTVDGDTDPKPIAESQQLEVPRY